MIERTVGQIAQMIDALNDVSQFAHLKIKGVTIDSRKVEPGNLFIPLKGEQADGHQYVERALQRGAVATFWQKDVPNPPDHAIIVNDPLLALQELARAYRKELTSLEVIGITGSNGKTTTKDITAAILGETFKVQKTEGNLNNHIGLPLTILSLRESTEIAIVEMGMSGKGEISLLTKIARPDVAIVTNIGEAHMLDLGSREAIATAKLEIVEGLRPGGLFIYPGNEPLLVTQVSLMKHVRVRTFGETPENDMYVLNMAQEERGSTFTASAYSKEPLFIPIPGKHNVMNTLAALLVARKFGIPFEHIKNGLKSVKLSTMRMEWRDGPKGSTILNDAYNASPTATRAVIQLIENMDPTREKIVVLGDMLELGKMEKQYHEQIGEEIDPNKIKYVFTYGLLGEHIAEGAKKNFPEERVFIFNNKEALASALEEKISGGEMVAVKASRGMRLEEVVEMLAKN